MCGQIIAVCILLGALALAFGVYVHQKFLSCSSYYFGIYNLTKFGNRDDSGLTSAERDYLTAALTNRLSGHHDGRVSSDATKLRMLFLYSCAICFAEVALIMIALTSGCF